MRRFCRLLPAVAATCLMCSPVLADVPTLDSMWPSEDGRSWTYAQHYEDIDGPTTIDNHTRIVFDGTVVAPNGIDAQYLRQFLVSGPIAPAVSGAISDPLLRQLSLARPDLRTRIARFAAATACPENGATGAYAILLGGELAYRKTAEEVAAWRCNQADTKSWIWLVSDLTIGNTFDLQLLPDLADSVYLHGTIAAIEPITVPAGTFPASLRVDYVIDYGSSGCRDENGNPLGTFRSKTLGHVHYVQDVGPVESSENFINVVEQDGTCFPDSQVGQVTAHVTMSLETLPTPVHARSWGRLKLLYR